MTPAIHMLVFCVLISFGALSYSLAENITPEIYPSEEELFEAFLRGEIDYQTYINLTEIVEGGIDSTELYLLEEIPNISYFLKSYISDYSNLEREQTESYIIADTLKETKRISGFLRARTYQKLTGNGENKSHLNLRSSLNEDWSLDMRFYESYADHRVWTKRSVVYKAREGPIKKMIFGNFTARFGLGLNVGYRGKMLNKNESSYGQSLAFPDYGGFNGAYIEGGQKKSTVRLLLHYDRNDNYSFHTAAFNLVRKYKSFRWEGIALGSIAENRLTDIKYKHYQLGAFVQYTKSSFNAAMELAFPRGASSSIPAAVFESRYKNGSIRLDLSAWHYSDDFVNLIGGGRAESYYRTITIDTIDFDFRDKRVDQRGLLFKSRARFQRDITWDISFSTYGRSAYEECIEVLTAVEIPLMTDSKFRLDFRYSWEEEFGRTLSQDEISVGYHLRAPKLHLRTHMGYSNDENEKKYLSCFARAKVNNEAFGSIELWMNLDKIDYKDRQIDYFYGYIRETFDLTGSLELAAKYSYRYNRSYTDPHQSIFLIEAKVKW